MRDIKDLENNALKFWPKEIAAQERSSSIIPRLIETQDKFISLLNIADANPFAWKVVLLSSKTLSANLFLKHLIVLSDIGGEMLMRFKSELPNVFKDNKLQFIWHSKNFIYEFQTLNGNKNWNNTNLLVDGEGISQNSKLLPIIEDVCNLLLFGGLSTSENVPSDINDKCNLGLLLGKKYELTKFVKQRYIWVSRITGGATANSLGQIAQNYVIEYSTIYILSVAEQTAAGAANIIDDGDVIEITGKFMETIVLNGFTVDKIETAMIFTGFNISKGQKNPLELYCPRLSFLPSSFDLLSDAGFGTIALSASILPDETIQGTDSAGNYLSQYFEYRTTK